MESPATRKLAIFLIGSELPSIPPRSNISHPNTMPSAMSEERSCLIVILGEQVRLAKGGAGPIQSFDSNGKCYRDCGFGEFTEFYDWLRNSRDEVLGVRYYLCSDTDFLFGYAQEIGYALCVDRGTFRYIEIYFSHQRDVDPLRSGDQDFLYDPVFRSDDGEIAIAFEMGSLSEPELLTLERFKATWTEVNRCA